MISVVIPARDAAGVISGQLAALARQEVAEPWEVIVADNGSRDGTRSVVAAWIGQIPSLRVVDASARPGVAHARNVGAGVARGAHLLFCDADDEVDDGWITAMAAGLRRYHAVGGRLDRRRLSERGALRAGQIRSDGLTPWPGCLPFATGASFGVRREIFTQLGGFDESFTRGANDVEFSWRVQRAGLALGFVGDAVVHYRERSGFRATARQFYGYGLHDPHLYRCFGPEAMPRSGWSRGVRSWGHLMLLAPWYLRTPARRAQWVRSCARRVGRIVGSVRHRTLYL